MTRERIMLCCGLCESTQAELVFRTHDMQFDIPEPFSVLRCRDCGLVFTHPKILPPDFGKFYPDGYIHTSDTQGADLGLLEKLFYAVGRKINPDYIERFPSGRILHVILYPLGLLLATTSLSSYMNIYARKVEEQSWLDASGASASR